MPEDRATRLTALPKSGTRVCLFGYPASAFRVPEFPFPGTLLARARYAIRRLSGDIERKGCRRMRLSVSDVASWITV